MRILLVTLALLAFSTSVLLAQESQTVVIEGNGGAPLQGLDGKNSFVRA